MSVALWSTREPLEASFESAWRARLASTPHAHFGFDPAFLIRQAKRGERALCVLLDEGPRRGAMVLREAGAELVSGWPWRWQAVIEGGESGSAAGMSPGEAEWLWTHAQRLAGVKRLRFYVPIPAGNGAPAFVAGATYLQTLDRSEDGLWKALDGAKRRMIKRAQTQEYQIVEANDHSLFRAFARLPREGRRRQSAPPASGGDAPPPGEGWREWEEPWMWLLVAVKNGSVEAGSGFGFQRGATVDYRTNASTPAAKKDGANALLAWEAMRLSRERGFHWINWGGATRFKQEFGGERVEIVCRLGGGPAWILPNALAASARRVRSRVSTWWRARAHAPAGARKSAAARVPARRPRAEGALMCWRTRHPLDPGFERTWREILKRAPLANFGFDLAYLEWEARHHRHALAVLVEDRGRRGALVLRETRGAWVCGWPWRWQAAVENGSAGTLPELSRDEAEWLFRHARRVVGARRLKFYVPTAAPPGIPGFEAGATIVQALDRSDEELLSSMHPSKRRMVRRALQDGYEVVEGATLEHFRAFSRVQRETFVRLGLRVDPEREGLPEPGEEWREWELPWMWLLLALRDGRVESGLGDGLSLGGMLEGRTGASTHAARMAGAFALLCHEEARRGRDKGFRWLNHGGDTSFKREVAGTLGTRLAMHCWLGGGSAWTLANRSEAWAWRARVRVPAWVRALRASGEKT